jgi:hypothetical protein
VEGYTTFRLQTSDRWCKIDRPLIGLSRSGGAGFLKVGAGSNGITLRGLSQPIFATKSTRSGPKGRVLHMSPPSPHHQCAFSTASTDVTPAIIEPVIAISAGTPRGNSRLISEAMKIAAMGRAMTK